MSVRINIVNICALLASLLSLLTPSSSARHWGVEELNNVVNSHSQTLVKMEKYQRITNYLWKWFIDNRQNLNELLREGGVKAYLDDTQLEEISFLREQILAIMSKDVTLQIFLTEQEITMKTVLSDIISLKKNILHIEKSTSHYNASLVNLMAYSNNIVDIANRSLAANLESKGAQLNQTVNQVETKVLQLSDKVNNSEEKVSSLSRSIQTIGDSLEKNFVLHNVEMSLKLKGIEDRLKTERKLFKEELQLSFQKTKENMREEIKHIFEEMVRDEISKLINSNNTDVLKTSTLNDSGSNSDLRLLNKQTEKKKSFNKSLNSKNKSLKKTTAKHNPNTDSNTSNFKSSIPFPEPSSDYYPDYFNQDLDSQDVFSEPVYLNKNQEENYQPRMIVYPKGEI